MRVTVRIGVALFALLSLVTLLQVVAEPVRETIVRGEVGKRVDEYMSRLEKYGFSGAVIVAKGGEIVLSKGYGLANRAKRIPFTAETVSSIGSITKQFTAAAILKLEMQGKLRVEDAISKYFPNVPADKTGITIHHLLTHTAGFRGDFGGSDDDAIARDALVKLVLAAPLENKPGERFEYSNEGYSLLGAIVEIVTRKSYEEFLREQIFLPAGMKDTGYVLPKWAAGRVARGYEEGREWGSITEKGWKADGPGWYLKANGGIHSTIGDMYRWHVALESDTVLSKAAREKYQKPYVAEGPPGMSRYAYGWNIETTPRKTTLVTHNGGNGVFFADYLRFVEEKTVIYIMSNGELSAIDASRAVSRAVFGEEYAMPPAVAAVGREQLAWLAGEYHTASGEKVIVTAGEGRLRVTATSGAAMALLNFLAPPGTRHAALENKTRAVIEASAKGDYETVRAALGGEMALERIREEESGMWQGRRERFGELQRVEVVGTGRRGPALSVHVRLHFERGAHVMRYTWDGERLLGMRVLERLPETPFLPQSATEFAAFNLRQGATVKLRFAVDAKGAATLRLAGEAGEITVQKEK